MDIHALIGGTPSISGGFQGSPGPGKAPDMPQGSGGIFIGNGYIEIDGFRLPIRQR